MDDGSGLAAIRQAMQHADADYRAWCGAAESATGVGAELLLPDILHDRSGPARGLGYVAGVNPSPAQVASYGPGRVTGDPGVLVYGAVPRYAEPGAADYRQFQNVPLSIGVRVGQPVAVDRLPRGGGAAVAPTPSGRRGFLSKVQAIFKRGWPGG